MAARPLLRRHTEAASFLIRGDRPLPKSGDQVLQVAEATQFLDNAVVRTRHDGGHVEFVPSAIDGDPFILALTEGIVLARLKVVGKRWKVLQPLKAGVYYIQVDFVEGPDFDEGRWIGRIIDGGGTVLCFTPNVEFKQILSFATKGERRIRETPTISIHGLGEKAVTRLLGATNDDFWMERCICATPPMIARSQFIGPKICRCFCVPIG